ncbi:MAG: hypothetical protein ACR2NB_00555, partial [Solirubrobacteraceae bacterium]
MHRGELGEGTCGDHTPCRPCVGLRGDDARHRTGRGQGTAAKTNGSSRRASDQTGTAVVAISVAVYVDSRGPSAAAAHLPGAAGAGQHAEQLAGGAERRRDAERAEDPRPDAHRRGHLEDAQHVEEA